MKKYTFEEINYIKNNYYIMSAKEIADYLNRPVSSIQCKISELGLSKAGAKNSSWTDEQIDILKANYQVLSYSQLCELIGKTEKAIKIKAHKLGIKKNPIYFNHDAFCKIMNEDDAYWLGFMFADGYVVKRDKFSYFGIELRKSDISHLRKFNIYLNGNLEIYTRHRESQIEGRDVSYDTAAILVTSDKIVDNLIYHGCVPRKSFVIDKPIDIRDDLIIPFIRGYFDGNGSFGIYNNGQYDIVKFNISCASIKFLEWIKDYLLEYNVKTNIVKDRNAYKLSGSSKSAKIFIDMIYNNSSINLDRKYKKYIEMRPVLQ